MRFIFTMTGTGDREMIISNLESEHTKTKHRAMIIVKSPHNPQRNSDEVNSEISGITNIVADLTQEDLGALVFIRMLLVTQGIEQNPGPIFLNYWIIQFVLVLTAVTALTILVLIKSLLLSPESPSTKQDKRPQDCLDTDTEEQIIPQNVLPTLQQSNHDFQKKQHHGKFKKSDPLQSQLPHEVKTQKSNHPQSPQQHDAKPLKSDPPQFPQHHHEKPQCPRIEISDDTNWTCQSSDDDQDDVDGLKRLKLAQEYQTGAQNVVLNVERVDTLQLGHGSRSWRYSSTSSDTGDSDIEPETIYSRCTDSPMKTHLLEYTESRLKTRLQPYVRRNGIDAAIRTLEENRVAVITGVSGEGKTCMALEIMSKIRNNEISKIQHKTPIIIHNATEWQTVIGMKDDFVVLIDDMFGISNCSYDVLNSWKQILKEMSIYVKMGNIYLLITSRAHVLDEVLLDLCQLQSLDQYGQLDDYLINKNVVVDLSQEYKLSESERATMLQSFTNNSLPHPLRESLLRTIIAQGDKTSIGFPQACFLFFSNEQLLSQGPSFFTDPLARLSDAISDMRSNNKRGYCALMYCLLSKHQEINPDEIDAKLEHKKYKKRLLMAADLCELNAQDCTAQSFIEALKFHTGRLIVFEEGKYKFHHDSIIKSALNVISQYDPELVLRTCDERLLIETVVVENQDRPENGLFVPKTQYSVLSERLFKVIKRDYSAIPSIRCFRSEVFLKYFCSHLKKDDKFQELFTVKSGIGSILEFCANNFTMLAFLLKNGIKNSIVRSTSENKYREHIQQALEKALSQGNVLSTKLLLGNGACFTKTTLFTASLSGNVELLKYLMQCNSWTKDRLQLGMRGAVMSKSSECVTYLHDNGAKFNKACLLDAVNYADLDCIIYIFTHYNATSSDLDDVMATACRRGNKEIITCFIEIGVNLTEQCLLELIEHLTTSNTNKEDVMNLVLHSNQWTSEQLARTLEEACSSQRLYICEILHKYGGTFSEQALLSAVATGTFEIVEYVLLAKNWSETQLTFALEDAILNGHNEIVKLVYEKGGKFTETCLINAVCSFNASLDLLEYITDIHTWSNDQLNLALSETVKNWKTSNTRLTCEDLCRSMVLHLICRGALLTESCLDDITDLDEDFAVKALQSTLGFIF